MTRLTDFDIISLIREWQRGSDKLVHVSYFTLQPQAQGFYLECEFYIADKYDPELGGQKKNFFGSLEECFYQAIQFMTDELERLRNLL
jgi:hypothetical protein